MYSEITVILNTPKILLFEVYKTIELILNEFTEITHLSFCIMKCMLVQTIFRAKVSSLEVNKKNTE